ncbi:MAG: DUF1553 domain-containing protein [Bryobacterales bacterium]|nr:DUF1553 domain-containing protein [Bryobacterales bacterium]
MRRWAVLPLAISLVLPAADTYTAAERRHWAFQKRTHPDIPAFTAVSGQAWVRTPVDAFILARLKKANITPAPAADPRTLIRRLYLDVTGLPPTPEETARFLASPTPQAWEKLVDALLASRGYGERQAQQWLDLVRFAETDGFEYDTQRHDAWRYRDYVIRSFETDKPYDQFVREQLAGDELDPNNEEYRVAAGFQRLGALRKNAGNQEVASSRNEVLTEMTNIVGAAFLGMTLGCARCHDHKFDPIRQKDYYRVQAYFAATQEAEVPISTAEQQAAWKAKTDALNTRIKDVKESMKGLEGAARLQKTKELEALEEQLPQPLPSLFSVQDDQTKAAPVHVLTRGEWNKRGDAVGMRPPGILLAPDIPDELPVTTPKPREILAAWLTAPDHPLTPRVMANRIWLSHFGRGIVNTPNDFGRMGLRPTHPELLDFLANQLVENGWHMKPIHRMILLSSTYQQASDRQLPEAAKEADPDNKLWWRFERHRLDSEQIRDSMLAMAGTLNLKPYGPSVIVPVQKELIGLLYKPSQWKVTEDASEHGRRSIYLLAKRNLRVPFMDVFDSPDRLVSCPRRESSTHAPQALELLNGAFSNQLAAVFAERLKREADASPQRMVERAFQLSAGRPPSSEELRTSLDFMKTQPLSEFALAVFNLNAFLYVN